VFESPQREEIFLYSTAFKPAPGPIHPPIQWVLGALSPGVKRPGREADHSPPSSAEVKNGGAVNPLPIRLHDLVVNYVVITRLTFTFYEHKCDSPLEGYHLDVVGGPSTPHDPESDAVGSLSSWQGHPSW
jgi:hypothetical protein